MTVWFTADLHFGHGNIIGYSSRPFGDAMAMDRGLIARWNNTVGEHDTVWVLGDVALGRIKDSLGLVVELNGRKLLLAGNHDRCWYGHERRSDAAKVASWTDRYLEAGFAEVHQREITLDIGGHEVSACHFPYRGDSHDQDRYVEERPVDNGRWLIHGHVHERWRQRHRMINVGVDAWDYRPVSEATLAAMIDSGADDLAPLQAKAATTTKAMSGYIQV